MNTQEYLDALRRLGLTPASSKAEEYEATAKALGLTTRQCQNIAAGRSRVRETLANLIHELLKQRSD